MCSLRARNHQSERLERDGALHNLTTVVLVLCCVDGDSELLVLCCVC